MNRPVRTLALLLAFSMVAACGTGGASGGDVLRVAFVYVGPRDDGGWSQQHDAGRLAVEAAFGDRVATTVRENVPDGAASERVFAELADEGYDVIFGTTFAYADQIVAAASRHPDVIFEHATGFDLADNLGTYNVAAEEGRYLEGMAAGAATKTGTIGFVAAFPLPTVIRGINALARGARAVNPDAEVHVVWTNAWYDPEREAAAAERLVADGADVLGQHQDSPATGEVADRHGIAWMGHNADMSAVAPDAWLTSTVWNWGSHYVKTVGNVLDGTWEPAHHYGGLADGMTQLAPFGERVDAATRSRIAEASTQIEQGSKRPFDGPISDSDGNVRVPDGTTISDEEILTMDWFVEGVVGDVFGGDPAS